MWLNSRLTHFLFVVITVDTLVLPPLMQYRKHFLSSSVLHKAPNTYWMTRKNEITLDDSISCRSAQSIRTKTHYHRSAIAFTEWNLEALWHSFITESTLQCNGKATAFKCVRRTHITHTQWIRVHCSVSHWWWMEKKRKTESKHHQIISLFAFNEKKSKSLFYSFFLSYFAVRHHCDGLTSTVKHLLEFK